MLCQGKNHSGKECKYQPLKDDIIIVNYINPIKK